ncbi:MAG: hypothetical protein JNN01_15905 [Opitutaceae bacterium]|nr:hypothetical protein [Opitutaceae bacterium]
MSIMVDTPLYSLAQNLEGPEWPIKDKKETPALYIDLTFAEAYESLVAKGQPMERFDQLVDILKETLAFDNPFGDMVAQAAVSTERDNPLLKNMTRLEIPEEFPIEFTALQENTLEFCSLEKLGTLGQFAVFAQGLSQAVIVGGDFRGLLNALSHVDEPALAKYLPFRPGKKGLHLIEAVALTVRSLTPEQRAIVISKPSQVHPATRDRVARLVAYFMDQKAELVAQIASGSSLARALVVIGDPALETVVNALLTPHLKNVPAPVSVAKSGSQPKSGKGWFSRLFSRS